MFLLLSKSLSLKFFINRNFLIFNFFNKFFFQIIQEFNFFLVKNLINYHKLFIFVSHINLFIKYNFEMLKYFIYQTIFFYFYLLKVHGINMRIIILKKSKKYNIIFFRLAFSHGIIVFLAKTNLIKIFKKRYLLLSSFDLNFLHNLIFNLKLCKKFFKYKLIGIKLLRDHVKILTGKKKTI